jgi:predicted ATP-grasp superfamily ATP-dependent carboligase
LRVFVSEYVCGGGWHGAAPAGSLATEGRAMLGAIVEDLSRIAGVKVVTTWDARLGPSPFRPAQVVQVKSAADEMLHFRRLAAECDATLVIAPEFNGILRDRCRIVEELEGRLLGPSSRAVALCADKLRLAVHLREAGVATIPTELVGEDAPRQFPGVIKPRYGAGSQDTHFIDNAGALDGLCREQPGDADRQQFIWQPYVAGPAVSVALFFALSRRAVEVLVPAEQRLTGDGRFCYLGGRVPCLLKYSERSAVQSAALAACRCIPGLRGYVGVDLILPEAAPHQPMIVEINPRLTTSYLGYRALAENNLAEWMLIPARFERAMQWRKGVVEFDAEGKIAR